MKTLRSTGRMEVVDKVVKSDALLQKEKMPSDLELNAKQLSPSNTNYSVLNWHRVL